MSHYSRIRIATLLLLMTLTFLAASLSVMAASMEGPGHVAGQEIRADTAGPDAVTTTSFVSGLAYVAMSNSNEVAMIDTVSHSYVGLIDVGSSGCFFPWRVAMSPDTAYVYVSCYNSSTSNVVVIDTGDNTVLTHISGIPDAADITFVQGGIYAMVGSRWYNQVKVIETATHTIVDTISTPGATRSLAVHPFADVVYVTSTNGSILAINTNTFTIEDTISVGGDPWDVVVSSDGQLVFAGDRGGGGLHIIDTATNDLVTTITGVGELTGLALTPDGQKLFAGGLYNGVHVFDIATLSYETLISVPGPVWDTAVTCDGTEVYVSNRTSTVRAIDTGSYDVLAAIVVGGTWARGIAICPELALSGVVLSPHIQTNTAALGETAIHQLTLFNTSDLTDSYDIELDGFAWDTAVSTAQVGPLLPGEQITFTVSVTVPTSADWYDTDNVTLLATSVTSPTVYSATAILTTEAFAPPTIGVAPESLASTQLVNEIVTQTLVISNSNSVTLTFGINAEPASGMLLEAHSVSNEGSAGLNSLPMWPARGETQQSQVRKSPIAFSNTATPPYLPVIITDPLGDGGPADAISVAAASTGTDMYMRITFAPGVIPTNVYGMVYLDTDRNPATGRLPSSHFGIPAQDTIGFDYYVNLISSLLGVYTANGTYVGPVSVTYSADSIEFAVPLSLLGDDDGFIDVNMVLGDSSGQTEWVPDAGHGTILGADIGWLTTNPVTGTLLSNSSLSVEVAFDSTNLQPGEYNAFLNVASNDPVTPVVAVPVTMTVEPTASMGWVEGVITDAGTGLPLEATVTAQGQPYTVTSNADTGAYIFWLEAGIYTVDVAAAGYVSATQTVEIIAQEGMTQDFALVLNVPVLSVTHDNMTVAQNMGQTTSRAVTITNDGPALLEFVINRRNTTTGLQFLSQYARSQDEIEAATAQTGDNGSNEQGASTFSTIPPEAFNQLAGHINILAWIGYADYDEEYANTLNAIAQYTTFSLVETSTTDSTELGSLLAAADVFLVPEQELTSYGTMFNLGMMWTAVLHDFVTDGGSIIVLDHCGQAYGVLDGSGLMDVTFNHCVLSGEWLDVIDTTHPLVEGVPNPFSGMNGMAFFSSTDGETIVQRQGSSQISVAAKETGNGRVTLIGFDFYSYNDDMARLLANAVLWGDYGVDWLSTVPEEGTVEGYSALSVAVTFDATGLQPGLYTADFIISSNDQVTPSYTIPVTMSVSPAAGMGQVTGTVTDLWTGDPLTATVELMGSYTATADPDYTIWAESGVHDLVVSAAGYMTATYAITIPADGVVVQDIALEPARPRLEMGISSLNETAVPGQLITQTFIITNSGPLPLEIDLFEVPSALQGLGTITADLTGVQILYDRAHGQPDLASYTTLHNDLVSAGAQIVQNFVYPITAAILEPYDILWLNCCGYTSWTFNELLALQNWLSDGGALFIHGSESPATSGPAQIFDINYQAGSCTSGTTTDITLHPISQEVSSVYMNYTCYYLQSSGEAVSVVRDPFGSDHIMAYEGSEGKMVMVAANDFNDSTINSADNRTLANNIMAWLSLAAYGDVPWLSVAPETATIAGHSSMTFSVTFDTADLDPGEYVAELAVEHNDPDQTAPLRLPVALEVIEQVAAVSLTPVTASDSTVPGQTVTYMLTVENIGNGPDTFAIAVEGDWLATPSLVTTGEMLPGETRSFSVVVAVPPSAAIGSSDVTTVMVQSEVDSAVSQSSTLTTTAVTSVYSLYLPLVIRP
ncbi:MAG: hypothetical protein R6X32_14390 [Chloroflexota bacterium]